MRTRQRSIPPSLWPQPEQLMLATAFGDAGRRRHRTEAYDWVDATRKTVLSLYCCGLGWLSDRGILNWHQMPAERWPEAVIEDYIDHLQACYAKATVYSRISGLERAIAILQPKADRGLLKAALIRLGRPIGNPEHEVRVQSSIDLLQLGLDIMDQADTGELTPQQAVSYRTGLQIALLALRPWRMSDYSRLRLDKSVYRCDGAWRMRARFRKTKRRRRAMDVAFPALLVPRLERYRAVYRPILCGSQYDGDALWVSIWEGPQSSGTIAWHVRKHTRKRFGRHVTPHHFRKCAVTTVAIHAPKQIRAVSTALGHGSLKVTTEHYNLAGAFSASVQLNSTIDEIIRAAKNRRRLGRRR